MKNRTLKFLLIAFLLVLLLAACQPSAAEEGPAEAYAAYYEYCEAKQYEIAEGYLGEEARAQIATIGVCGFTHDAINRVVAESGGVTRVFTEEPQTDISEDRAVISWIDDQGYLSIVHLVNTEDGWKVVYTVWSD